MLEVLAKRFPFRILPKLPPKRLGGRILAGNSWFHDTSAFIADLYSVTFSLFLISILADEAFLERRLRGLIRFMNALVRHPVLRNDPLVISFLTEPVVSYSVPYIHSTWTLYLYLNWSGLLFRCTKELAVWRKNVVISTDDEFTTRLPISESLSKQVPHTLDTELEKIKKRLPTSIEYYRTIVHVLDRIQKRTEASAADYTRYSLALK